MISKKIINFLGLGSVILSLISFILAFNDNSRIIISNEAKSFTININILIAFILSSFAGVFSVLLSRKIICKLRNNKIFILYSQKDIDIAINLANKLRDYGYNLWLYTEEILPGSLFNEIIQTRIKNSTVVLYMISKNSENDECISQLFNFSLTNVISKNKDFSPIIPIIIDETNLPLELKDVKYVNLKNKNSLKQLINSLNYIIDRK